METFSSNCKKNENRLSYHLFSVFELTLRKNKKYVTLSSRTDS